MPDKTAISIPVTIELDGRMPVYCPECGRLLFKIFMGGDTHFQLDMLEIVCPQCHSRLIWPAAGKAGKLPNRTD
jgi:DNA-directed RNA polymerase subunit RPC12/RpoP